MTEEAIIDIRHLCHTFKSGFKALDDVNLNFGVGVFGLLGPNGAGKSTLMRILCTLLPPSSGEVRVCGHDVTKDPMAIRSQLGYLPQEFGAWRSHRVEEVLDTLAQLSGMLDKPSRREQVTRVLEDVGLADVADRKVKKLSGGMLRRLGVAQALIHGPKVIVVDEPTVGLDPEERIRFRNVMTSLGRDRTILLSTHIVADLGGACKEIALLDGGQIIYQGTPSGLVSAAIGQVFQVAVSEMEFANIESQYEVVSTSVGSGSIVVRGVSHTDQLPDGAEIVQEPSLEESYMAFMAARGRSGVASQAEEHTEDIAVNEASK
jgi:ABC-2 type transport system ATP-binding protein